MLAVYRERQFSPGKVEADAAILDAVLGELLGQGFESVAVTGENFSRQSPSADPRLAVVLAMCQGRDALAHLSWFEQAGIITVNTARSIRNCYRDTLNTRLAQVGIPTPVAVLLSTSMSASDLAAAEGSALGGIDLGRRLYVKRGDLHALGPDDVVAVDGLGQFCEALANFARRGVKLAFAQQEAKGRLVKFYGVSGEQYFAALVQEGALAGDIGRALGDIAARGATALGLEFWGGDAVLDAGGFTIIDFNDWPSYSAVRAEAARAIARRCIMLLEGGRGGL